MASSFDFAMWDLSLPGYKYLGPGNKLNKGKPLNYNDWVAYLHDHGYDKLLKQGKNPYLKYNEADRVAEASFTNSDYGGALGKLFFKGKRYAHQVGLIGHTDDKSAKRLRGSFTNLTSEAPSGNQVTTMAQDGAGSGNDQGTKETPIDEVVNVSRGPPDYTFASLPFMSQRKVSLNTFAADLSWRMTSPYDPEVSILNPSSIPGNTGTQVHPATTSDPDASISKARWFDFYAGLYKYYHVVSCRYSVIIENLSGEPLYVHKLFYNTDLPPIGATNEDIMAWKDTETRILNSPYKAVTNIGAVSTTEVPAGGINTINDESGAVPSITTQYQSGNHVVSRGNGCICEFSGTYATGDFRREIITDSLVENWTLVNANPALSERLLLRFKPESSSLQANASNYGDNLLFKVYAKFEYLVEFKELVDGLRWPVQRQPLTITVNQDVYSTN